MKQICVDLEFDSNDDPTYFVAEDGSVKFPYDSVESVDWKDTGGQESAIDSLEAEVVILFDGSDSTIYASMDQAIHLS